MLDYTPFVWPKPMWRPAKRWLLAQRAQRHHREEPRSGDGGSRGHGAHGDQGRHNQQTLTRDNERAFFPSWLAELAQFK